MTKLTAPLFLSLSLLGLAQAGPSGEAYAQVVRGHLYDAETGEPVSNGVVALRGSLGTVLDRTASDSLGAFSLNAPRPGMYSLMATGLGYKSASTLQFDVGAEGTTTVDVRLEPEPIELDSLGVEGERRRIIPHLQKQGFYQRAGDGFGHFIAPEEIEARNPRFFSDLLRSLPGVSADRSGNVDLGPRCRNFSPRLWIDGVLVDDRGIPLGWHVSIDEIAAIEVYLGAASTPLQYGGVQGQCVMLVWTKG